MKKIFAFLTILAAALGAHAQLSMPRFFSDGMVVQRGEAIPLWGKGTAGSTVVAQLNGKKAKAKVAADGTWQLQLPKMKAGGPYELTVSDGNTAHIHIKDVLVGDVFLCSGQSNMELPIQRCMDAVADKVKGYSNNQVRYLKLPHQFNYMRPNDDCQINPWVALSPETMGPIGAVCYFTGRNLQEAENVPIGIINSSVGGTRVECWMDRPTLASFPAYTDELAKRKYHQEDWVDSVRRAENRAGFEWERTMLQRDTISGRWKQADYSFAEWPSVDIFSRWAFDAPTTDGQGRYGAYYFHKQLTLTAGQAGKEALLRLGAMKDADSVFVNGTFVGFTSYEYPPRNYKVPAGILREGANDIVIKLMAQTGNPNFTSGKLYQLEVGDDVIKIDQQWQMRRGSAMKAKPGSTYFVDTPTGLYNAMIAPFRNLPIKGAVWYQGESNQGGKQYSELLQAMVKSWRKQFGREFPIVVIQLAGYMQHHDKAMQNSGWCNIREAQFDAAAKLNNAALATAIDLGEWNDIHPQRKDELGRRVALQLRRLAYGEKNLVSEGPRAISAQFVDGSIVVKYDAKTGAIRPFESSDEFAVRADGNYVYAHAERVDDYTVRVSLPEGMGTPTSLRYAYDDYPTVKLYNTDGIPSPQFTIEVK